MEDALTKIQRLALDVAAFIFLLTVAAVILSYATMALDHWFPPTRN